MLRTLSFASKHAKKYVGISTMKFSTEVATTSRPEPQVADSLLQIGTRRIFDFEHDMYRELCRKFYVDHVNPYREVSCGTIKESTNVHIIDCAV